MMAMSKRCRLSSLLFVLSLVNFPFIAISETPCPYPCYPPPTGAGGGGSTQPASYYPQPTGYYPPPTSGNVPYYPTPPYVGGNPGGYYGPPPPDPVWPYFPYYFRKPPHQTDQTSSSFLPVKSTVRIVTVTNLVAVLVVLGNFLVTT